MRTLGRNTTLELSVSQQYFQLANIEPTAERESKKEHVALRYFQKLSGSVDTFGHLTHAFLWRCAKWSKAESFNYIYSSEAQAVDLPRPRITLRVTHRRRARGLW
jgi:hypothetical protein